MVFDMKTIENAQEAFAGESQASRKYTAFALKAEDEGYPVIAKLFKAAAEAEMIHAKRLIGVLDLVGSTQENLQAGIEGETEEFTNMYPAFIEVAQTEKQAAAEVVFTHAMKAEQVHAGRYKLALEAVLAGKDFEASAVYLCPVCGNVELEKPPARCPICGVPGAKFQLIE